MGKAVAHKLYEDCAIRQKQNRCKRLQNSNDHNKTIFLAPATMSYSVNRLMSFSFLIHLLFSFSNTTAFNSIIAYTLQTTQV